MFYFFYFSITFSFIIGYYYGFQHGIVKKCEWCFNNLQPTIFYKKWLR